MNFGGGLCLVAFGVLSVSGVAAAQVAPARVALRWTAPDECPDDVQLVHRVEALLGESLLDAGEQALLVRASAQGNPDKGYAAKVSFTGAQGTEERYLEHPSCENLVQALALVIALAIDPERVRATQQTRDAQADAHATVERPAPSAPPEPVNPPPARAEPNAAAPASSDRGSPLRGARFALHGVAGAGPLPGLGAGLEATLGWHLRSFRAQLVGRYWMPRETQLHDAPVSLDLALNTLGARACFQPLTGAWQVAACAGGDLGDMSASGSGGGLQNLKAPHALYGDLAGGLELAYTGSRLSPEGGFEVSGALSRPLFGIRQDDTPDSVSAFRPAAWGFSVFLGLAFEL
jgi:hypothetical protein